MANLYLAENAILIHFNKRDKGNREAENSAASKSRMDFYFAPQHFPPVEIRLYMKHV